MLKLIAQNDEATLAFRAMAASVMRFLAGEEDTDLCERVLQCADALDLDGGQIKIIDFSARSDDSDFATNLIIQGALLMVASTISMGHSEGEEYMRGVLLMADGLARIEEAALKLRAVRR